MESNTAAVELQKTLLRSVSHNLRAPLASITSVLDTLIEDRGLLDVATERELLQSARDQASRLSRLITNLLDIARIDGGAIHLQKERWEVGDMIAAALLQLVPKPPEGVISMDIPRDLPLVPMDFSLMAQSMVNIVDNALKYSPKGQPIEIKARRADGAARIEVADRGRGIAAENLERVFDKFYSSSNGTGIGLGLAISKGLVEAHGGSIRASNRAGGGTMITLTLPLALEGAAP